MAERFPQHAVRENNLIVLRSGNQTLQLQTNQPGHGLKHRLV
jgi:hypothetical protein